MNQASECLVQIGDDLPRRRSRDSGSTVHHPRGRRNDRLQSELGKRLCWVARYSTLSWPWLLGTDVVSSARLKDEALSCGCCDDYGTVQESDGFGFGLEMLLAMTAVEEGRHVELECYDSWKVGSMQGTMEAEVRLRL